MNEFLKEFGFDTTLWDEQTVDTIYKSMMWYMPVWIMVLNNLFATYFWLKFSKVEISQKPMSDKVDGLHVTFPSRQELSIKSLRGKSTHDIWVNDDRDCIINGIIHSVNPETKEILPITLN